MMATRREITGVESEIAVVLIYIEEAEVYISEYEKDKRNKKALASLHGTVCGVRGRLNSLAAQLDHALNGPGDGPEEKY
jgi:hypothetical protein